MINKLKELFHDKFTIHALIFGLIINVFCISLCICSPQVVHAASVTQSLPYIVTVDVPILDSYKSTMSSGSYSQNFDFEHGGVIGWWVIDNGYFVQHFAVPVKDNYSDYYSISFDSGSFDSFDDSSNSLTISFTGGGSSSNDIANRKYVHVYFKQSSRNTTTGSYTTTRSANNYSVTFGGNGVPFSHINYLTSSFYDSQGNIIFTLPPTSILPDTSDPLSPNMSGLDLDSSLNTGSVPSAPSYSNNFSDPLPTWDTTAPFESLFDIVQWGFDRAYSLFNSFREYFFSWLSYFINILTYLIQKIIDAIKYIVTWFYNQFLNWLNPYLQIIKLIAGFLYNDGQQKSIFDLMFEFFGAVAQWLTQFWQNSFIVNFWTNFVTNLEDIVEDVLDKIDDVVTAVDNIRLLFTRDPDYSLIVTSFYTTYIGHIYQAIMRLLGAIVDGFTSIQAPGTLSFTVNFSSAPSPFDSVGYFTFNFDWYENIRGVVVPIVTACVYFGVGLHLVYSWRCMLMDTASLKPEVTIQPYSPTPGKAKVNYTSSGAAGGGLVPTWRTYPGQKRIRG